MVYHKCELFPVCIGSGVFVFCMFFMTLLVISRRRLSVSRPSVCVCDHILKAVGKITYSLPERISPNLQLRCSWGQR